MFIIYFSFDKIHSLLIAHCYYTVVVNIILVFFFSIFYALFKIKIFTFVIGIGDNHNRYSNNVLQYIILKIRTFYIYKKKHTMVNIMRLSRWYTIILVINKMIWFVLFAQKNKKSDCPFYSPVANYIILLLYLF